jgi:hypothetical protein
MARVRVRSRHALAALAALAIALIATSAAAASPFDPSGLIRVAQGGPRFGANQSNNWFGYNQGSLANGGHLFNSIGGTWSVPVAKPHKSKQAEHSATWIGIGGGCVDAGCLLTDPTGLIQTGTEQDVSRSGKASYSAWWELVPLPATTIRHMKIRPGDRIHASVAETSSGGTRWRITLQDLTRHEKFTTTTPYPSSRATAEWIEETPVTISSSGSGIAPLPKLSRTPFSGATVNKHSAHLKRSQRIVLTQGSRAIGTPSLPTHQGRGFVACSWASRCPRR